MRVSRCTFPHIRRWLVWHVPTCREIRDVLWVDDQAMQVAVIDRPYRLTADMELSVTVHQHQRVVVQVPAALILVDPVDDPAPQEDVASRVAVELVDGDLHA
ncbi:MAG: hypothetical protein J0M00_17585 [Burkholderiales bacterium]|nr:hypothetical protein [Burkholderiales bacterium]